MNEMSNEHCSQHFNAISKLKVQIVTHNGILEHIMY